MTGMRLRDVGVELGGKPIVRSVSLEIRSGSWLAVIGPNGAGKSTLLRAVVGALPHSGEIIFDGIEPGRGYARRRARQVAYVAQEPLMPPDLTVGAYVLLGRTPFLGYLSAESACDREIASSALDRLDLTGFADRTLGTLSGGERRRAVLARALAQQPSVVLLDEPTAALDLGHEQQMLDLIDELRVDSGLTVVTTLHDLNAASQYADKLALLSGGEVVGAGTAAEVLTDQVLATYYGARVEILDGDTARPRVLLSRRVHRND